MPMNKRGDACCSGFLAVTHMCSVYIGFLSVTHDLRDAYAKESYQLL